MSVLEKSLKTCQVLVAAIMAGAISFAAAIVVVVQSGQMTKPSPGGNLDMLIYIVPAVGIGALLGMFVIRAAMAKAAAGAVAQLRDEDAVAGAIAVSFTKVTMITAAILEGPALLSIVATLITGRFEFLAGATACLIVMTVMFPTNGRLERWAQRVSGPLS